MIVAEGYMDVIALHGAGFTGAVAPLGTALTEGQLGEMWKLADEPYLCFDGDNAGRRAAQRAADRALPLLRPGKSLRFVALPAGEDPDSLIRARGPDAVRRVLELARPLADVIWELETDGKPADTPERRASIKAALLAKVGAIGDGSSPSPTTGSEMSRPPGQGASPAAVGPLAGRRPAAVRSRRHRDRSPPPSPPARPPGWPGPISTAPARSGPCWAP